MTDSDDQAAKARRILESARKRLADLADTPGDDQELQRAVADLLGRAIDDPRAVVRIVKI